MDTADVSPAIFALSSRAEKKWDELDEDGNGWLEGEEILLLAEWAWGSFRCRYHCIIESRNRRP